MKFWRIVFWLLWLIVVIWCGSKVFGENGPTRSNLPQDTIYYQVPPVTAPTTVVTIPNVTQTTDPSQIYIGGGITQTVTVDVPSYEETYQQCEDAGVLDECLANGLAP